MANSPTQLKATEAESLSPSIKDSGTDSSVRLAVNELDRFIESTQMKDINASLQLVHQASNANSNCFFDNTVTFLNAIGPKDGLESMLAAQMVAVHNMAMTFSSLAMTNGQTPEEIDRNLNRVTKLQRTFTAQIEALNKHRQKGQHPTQVQNVKVNQGGQAVIAQQAGG